MGSHQILNQHNRYVDGDKNLKEIKSMIKNGLSFTYIQGKKITVTKDTRIIDERVTVLFVEGL